MRILIKVIKKEKEKEKNGFKNFISLLLLDHILECNLILFEFDKTFSYVIVRFEFEGKEIIILTQIFYLL